MFINVLIAKMEFPIEKEPDLEKTEIFFTTKPNTSCSIKEEL